MYDGVFPQTEKPDNFNKCGIYIYKRKAELNSRQINLYFSIKYNMFGGVCFVPVMWKKAAEYILVIRAEVCVLKVLLIYKRRGR